MKAITIKSIDYYVVALPLVAPMQTSFGTAVDKAAVIVELTTTDGVTGWGEAAVMTSPGYGHETIATAVHVLRDFLIPLLVGKTVEKAPDIPRLIRSVRGNDHTRAGIEAAVWDALARTNDMRLADYFALFTPEGHQPRSKASVGVSIGIKPTVAETITTIQGYLDHGYKRIKLKIKRGWDIELTRGVREALPNIMLMLDANSDYTLEDIDHLRLLDPFNLLMIEQPLAHDDIYEHSKLQAQMQTPICLDESVKTVGDLNLALDTGAIRILNLKPARVGGYSESLKIYDVCVAHDLPLWIGGMLETGIGRAANVAFASLPGVTLPSDISATDRYFTQDITEPPFVLNDDSTLDVPDGYGIGVDIHRDRIETAADHWRHINPYKEPLWT